MRRRSIQILSPKEENNLIGTDTDGNTALHNSIFENKIDKVKKLIEEKVDLNLQNNYLETPIHLATQLVILTNFFFILKFNLNFFFFFFTFFQRKNNKEIFELLILNKVDPNKKDRRGWTPLHRF